jgi:hypothetical protein
LQDHPKDAEYLNTRFYDEMETISGSTTATGRFAVGSNERLDLNSNTNDTVAGKMGAHLGTSWGMRSLTLVRAARPLSLIAL